MKQKRNFGVLVLTQEICIDFNDEKGFAAAKEKFRELGDEFSSNEPIKKYGKSVAETLNNHCDSAKLFKNC